MALPRAEKLIVFGIAAALLIPLALIVGKRWAGPDAERRAALALIREPVPPVRGRDGSDAIWLLAHDVPASQREEVARQVRRYLDAASLLTEQGKDEERDALRDPRDSFSEFAKIREDAPGLCQRKTPDCLAYVRADPQATQQALATQASSLRAALALHAYDGMRVGTRPSVSSSVPRYGIQRPLVVSHYALMFVEGQPLEALAGVCADAAAWRRLGGDSDVLIGSMVGVAYVREDLALMAAMLATMPADTALPPDCGAALVATEDYELDLCPSMKYEFGMAENMVLEDHRGIFPLWTRVRDATIDLESMLGVQASQLAPYCSAPALANSRRDRPWSSLSLEVARCGRLEKWADPWGCVLVDMLPSSFGRYVDRRTDLAASVALMRTVVWLRKQSPDPASWPALLPKRPASLGLKREPKIYADGARISIALLDQSRDKEFSLALPVVSKSVTPADATARSSQ